MQVLSPIYLLGLLTVAIPILIHLIRRRKVTVVAWAAHRFIQAVSRKMRKRKRVDEIILLCLRCLLFLLLALLFARPFFPKPEDALVEEEDGPLVVLVDVSASMAYGNGVRTRYDVARDKVAEILEDMPESKPVALVLFSDQAYPVVSPPTREHNVVLRQMQRQKPRPGGSNVAAGLSAALDLLSSGGGHVLLITDGQAVAWQNREEIARLIGQAEEQSIRIQLYDAADGNEVANLGITEFAAENYQPLAGQATSLRITVENGGSGASAETRIVLEQEPGVPTIEARVPALAPGEATTVKMETSFMDSGWQCLTARLAGDKFGMDDSRTIGLSVFEGLHLGIVEGRRNRDLSVRPGFFLSLAAVPVTGVRAKGFPVKATVLKVDALDSDVLGRFGAIALAGVQSLSSTDADLIVKYVENGGGLIILPPSNEKDAREFADNPLLKELLPAKKLTLSESSFARPVAAPYEHPITAFWNDGNAGSLDRFIADRHLKIEKSDEAENVLVLGNGDPLFVSATHGSGRVFLSALPLDNSWSGLPLSPQFVPLVQRTLFWLSGSTEAPASLSPGESWRMRVPAIHVGHPFYAATPAGDGEPQFAGQVEFQDGQAIVSYSDTRTAGRYSLYLEADGKPMGSFGVNLDAGESDLRPIGPDELEELSGGLFQWMPREKASKVKKAAAFFGLHELWQVIACLMLLVGAVEFYLAQRFSGPR